MASFYTNIISEIEKEIDNTELQKAAKDLTIYYNTSNKDITSPLDYNNPAYCCAYLYKHADTQTKMTKKYFHKMCKKKEIKDVLLRKKEIKICCLGGGPGIEIVGICKALAYSPSMHNKVRRVSVLDEFHGWESFFESIMSSLADGKDEVLPQTFFRESLRKEFLQVEFQYPLSKKAKEVISQADIVCLTKYSPEFSIEKGACISQVLGKLFKKNALIFYIVRSEKISFEDVDYISRSSNFKVVLGPLEGEKFENKFLKSNVKTYRCYPHIILKVSVIGWIKTSTVGDAFYNESLSFSHSSLTDVESIGTESEIVDSNVPQGKAMNSDVESEIVYSDMESEKIYSDIGSEVVHSDIESEVVLSDIGSELVHSDMESEAVHSDMESEVVDSDMESEVVHSDMESEVVHSDMGNEVVHSDIGNEVVLSDIGSELVHSDMGRKAVYSVMGSKAVYSDMGSKAVYSDMGNGVVPSDTGRKVVYSDMKREIMNSDKESEVMNFDVKRKAVDSSENRNDSKMSKSSELVHYDMKLNEKCSNMACNKYTQTEDSFHSSQDDRIRGITEVELEELLEALSGLVTIVERFAFTEKTNR